MRQRGHICRELAWRGCGFLFNGEYRHEGKVDGQMELKAILSLSYDNLKTNHERYDYDYPFLSVISMFLFGPFPPFPFLYFMFSIPALGDERCAPIVWFGIHLYDSQCMLERCQDF